MRFRFPRKSKQVRSYKAIILGVKEVIRPSKIPIEIKQKFRGIGLYVPDVLEDSVFTAHVANLNM